MCALIGPCLCLRRWSMLFGCSVARAGVRESSGQGAPAADL